MTPINNRILAVFDQIIPALMLDVYTVRCRCPFLLLFFRILNMTQGNGQKSLHKTDLLPFSNIERRLSRQQKGRKRGTCWKFSKHAHTSQYRKASIRWMNGVHWTAMEYYVNIYVRLLST
jgi:hypothetical protein